MIRKRFRCTLNPVNSAWTVSNPVVEAGNEMVGRDLDQRRNTRAALLLAFEAAVGEAALIGKVDGARDFAL